MKTQVQDGMTLELTAPGGGVTTGVPLLIGSLFVIPMVTADAAAKFNGVTRGVHLLAKTSAQAWTEGQKIYWDNGNSRCDSDSTKGPLIGVAAAVAANPSATGAVLLNGGAADLLEGAQAAIVTLTDSTGLSGTHNDTLSATTVPADLTGGESPTEAEHNALLAVVRVIAQNESDLGQKVIEILAALVAAGIIAA